MAKLRDVCAFINGDRSSNYPSKDEFVSAGVPFINAGHLVDGSVCLDDMNYISNDKYEHLTSGKILDGDLLYCLRGSLGKKAIVRNITIGAIASSLVIIRPDTSRLSAEYLSYALESHSATAQLFAANNGSSQPNLSADSVRNFSIELPSLARQQIILRRMEKITSLVALRKQQLAKLDELVKARFVEMFGDCKTNPKRWKTEHLEDVAAVGSSKRVFVEDLKDEGIPFYRGTEVGALAEGKNISPELFITEKHYAELCKATGAPKVGDLLMPSICPDGRIWVVNSEEPFYFKDGRVLWVHDITDGYDPIFLLYTLKDRIMTDYLSIASGTTFAELKIFALKQCQVFAVPLEQQRMFASFIKQVDKSKVVVQQSLDKLETLKKALMQEYFG